MKTIRAAKAGFCMGVSLALRKLDTALEENPKSQKNLRICTLGPIIHNPQVLEHYRKLGVACLEDCSRIKPEDHLIIRAHGITREEEAHAHKTAAVIQDATCPRVKNAQMAIYETTEPSRELLLFGEPDHPEVRGLLSYARGEATVFQSLSEIMADKRDVGKTHVLASQTTQDKEIFSEISETLRKIFPNLIILNTICDATRQRQHETLEIARKVDCMVVVGGKSSGNTRRLAAIARETGIPVFHIETGADLDKNDFRNFKMAGLTAGASTPSELIDEIETWLLAL